ncbi:MAG: bifunctional DNA-binding transcriptional regulator/O6-methylguanine-DNA methyltransferase Ada [Salinisphaeraceae bacterium]|nr:bifunctional DNA-binding transcriptional regulator/O6-methylguanine-DNA methyltransferase Ada [Salinisphaeraceae bacterium]
MTRSTATAGPDTRHAQDPRVDAVMRRDSRANGQFVYAVKTTGIYCQPGCPSRRPLLRNLLIFDEAGAAESAGFRACRRCRPNTVEPDTGLAIVQAACRRIERSETTVSLQVLATAAGMSRHAFHRLFQKRLGLTPRQYAQAMRERRLRASLAAGSSATDAIVEAGYSSSSRFYESSRQVLGMNPTTYREGGKDMNIQFAVGETSLGSVLVAATADGVCAILMDDDPQALVDDLQQRFPGANLRGGDAAFDEHVARVISVIDQPQASVELPLDIRGTAFQKRVWQALCRIPPGRTVTYAELARQIGQPTAARAVASACAANKLGVVIPCHRVVRANGGLSGYRWGVERKRELLRREAAALDDSP